MSRIALCDDNQADLDRMKSLLAQEYAAMEHGSDGLPSGVAIDAFPSGDALLKRVESGARYDAFFVDILMDRMTGLDVVRRLNQIHGRRFDLVFTTNSADFALEAFGVSAVDYLLKPIDAGKLRRALARCRNLRKTPDCITITKNKRQYRVVREEIAYIESFAHVCVFHLNGAEISTYMAMNAVTELVNSAAFVRCHKSYIVNLAFVQSVNSDYLTLCDQTVIPISRAMRRQIHDLYNEFLIRKVWEKRQSD